MCADPRFDLAGHAVVGVLEAGCPGALEAARRRPMRRPRSCAPSAHERACQGLQATCEGSSRRASPGLPRRRCAPSAHERAYQGLQATCEGSSRRAWPGLPRRAGCGSRELPAIGLAAAIQTHSLCTPRSRPLHALVHSVPHWLSTSDYLNLLFRILFHCFHGLSSRLPRHAGVPD